MTKRLKTTTVATLVFSLILTSIIYACSSRDFTAESPSHAAHVSMDRGALRTDPCARNKADVCASVRRNLLSIQALQTAWNQPAQPFVVDQPLSTETLLARAAGLYAAWLRPVVYQITAKVSLVVFHLALRI
jgi:hypothetical protein